MLLKRMYLKNPREILERSKGYRKGWAYEWRWGSSLCVEKGGCWGQQKKTNQSSALMLRWWEFQTDQPWLDSTSRRPPFLLPKAGLAVFSPSAVLPRSAVGTPTQRWPLKSASRDGTWTCTGSLALHSVFILDSLIKDALKDTDQASH